jgi:hypothetical protein
MLELVERGMKMRKFLILAALAFDLVGGTIIVMTIHAHQAVACIGVNCTAQ